MWPSDTRLADSGLLTLLLVSLAALSASLAVTEPGTAWYWPTLLVLGYAVGAVVVRTLDRSTEWLSRDRRGAVTIAPIGVGVGVLLVVAPFAEGAVRVFSSTHFRPLEQVTIVALMNVAFFITALPRVRRSGAAAIGVSFGLVLAGLMLGEHAAIVPLTAAYGGLCVAWLAAGYWTRLTRGLDLTNAHRMPLFPIVGLVVLLATVTAASTRIAQGIPDVWGEWVPSSGGSRWANPDALLGVGEGDWAISGPNAQSTGSVDSDYFLESDLPTLFDVMTETYGEPRPPEQVLRAIFVKQDQLLSTSAHKAHDAGAGGRQFSIYRKGRTQHPSEKRRDEGALLYVEGHVPLHLAMTVYDTFDGVSWSEPPERNEACHLESRGPDPSWLWLPREDNPEFLADAREHQLRLGRLSCDLLPLPSHLERFRLGRHDGRHVKRWALAILNWAHDGILRARQCLPSGVHVEVAARTVDRSTLFQLDHLACRGVANDAYLSVPDHLESSALSLAERFTHLPRGWRQIDAAVEHLRAHYAHDRDAAVPPTCIDPIHHFLHEARGGPAYQFATAATLALRSLGYPTRVVSGFYAHPDDFVAQSGNTPIHADDAHFWIEVRTAQGDWITFDPTPGYRTAWHRATFLDSAEHLAGRLAGTLRERPLITFAGLFMSVVLWWRRWWLQERFLTLWCLSWPYRSTECRLAHTLRLFDVRSRLSGRQRPPASPPLAWYRTVDDPACRAYLHCLYAVLYGGVEHTASAARREVEQTCRAAVKALRRDQLRKRPDHA